MATNTVLKMYCIIKWYADHKIYLCRLFYIFILAPRLESSSSKAIARNIRGVFTRIKKNPTNDGDFCKSTVIQVLKSQENGPKCYKKGSTQPHHITITTP